MKKNVIFGSLVVLFLVSITTLSIATTTCVTSGEGYASYEVGPMQRIYDLMASPAPEDEAVLQQTIQEFIADKLIFIPKPGVVVEYMWAPEKGVIHVRPTDSARSYWILRGYLKNCR